MAASVVAGAAVAVQNPDFSGSSSTFTDVNGGTDFSAGTTVCVAVSLYGSSAPTSVTLGGLSMTVTSAVAVYSGGDQVALYYVDLSENATDTVVVSYADGNAYYVAVCAWALSGVASGGPSAYAINDSLGNNPISVTLALPSGGAIIAAAQATSETETAPTWTEMSSSSGDFNEYTSGQLQLSGAHSVSASNPSVSQVGFNSVLAAAAWTPAASGQTSGGSGVASVMRDPDVKIHGWFSPNSLPVVEWFDKNEPEPSGGSAYSITIGEGTYTFSGTAITPEIGLPPGEGSYAFTGSAITPEVGLPLGEGSYAFDGTALTPEIGLPLSGGSYAFDGSAITPEIGLSLGEGSYAFDGTAASFPVALSLDAGSGSYAFDGTAVSLTYTPSGTAPAPRFLPFHATVGQLKSF